MDSGALLAANLASLRRGDPALAERLRAIAPDPRVEAVRSRTGHLVPRLRLGGRSLAMHSLVDPQREAERAAESVSAAEYMVCLGLGGGYHLAPLLRRAGTSRLLVVESGEGILRALMGSVDLGDLLGDPRVRIVASSDPEEAGRTLLGDYAPVAYRSLCTVPLRSRIDSERPYFAAATRAVERAVAEAVADYGVQARFGLRWLGNTLRNLLSIHAGLLPGGPDGLSAGGADALGLAWPRVLVTGAGPSLEMQIPRIRELRPRSHLIATDASVATLRAAGLSPDAVLSIDCQQIVYHHFLGGMPDDSLLVLDLASPPLLARRAARVAFVGTRHPLSSYLNARGLGLRTIDVTGGNVSHAAVSLGASLGAREIRLFGVDLSYPSDKPYARGCFLYPALESRVDRRAPLESRVYEFALSSPTSRRVPAPGGTARVDDSMLAYRSGLLALAARSEAAVIQEPGLGPPLELRGGDASPSGGPLSVGSCVSVGTLLRSYGAELAALPPLRGTLPHFVRSLDPTEREALATLLPVAAALQARLGYPDLPFLLESARLRVLRSLGEGFAN